MSLAVSVDLDSPIPHYEQLRVQIAALITAGSLPDGQRMPTVRALANDLGVAAGTVARTYRDLEAAGMVSSARRRGTRVTAPPATLEREVVTTAARELVDLARTHGLSDSAIRDVVAAALLHEHTERRAARR